MISWRRCGARCRELWFFSWHQTVGADKYLGKVEDQGDGWCAFTADGELVLKREQMGEAMALLRRHVEIEGRKHKEASE